MDFLVHTDKCYVYDDEIRQLGSKIIPCLHPSRPLSYARRLWRVLRDCGPYDIVHSHLHHYSGFVLRVARNAGVRCRISHSHNDTRLQDSAAGAIRSLYLRTMKRWIAQEATTGLAASRRAAAALWGESWTREPRWRVLHYGIELSPFCQTLERATVRADLGIRPDGLVVGHVGRLSHQKNHLFLLKIARELVKWRSDAYFLLVGEGPMRRQLEQMVRNSGLNGKVLLLGERGDVSRLMLGAMDVFVFPSLFEGLGIALIEAQAAGLPCVISDRIPAEADVVRALVHRLPLEESAAKWVETILAAHAAKDIPSQQQALETVRKSSFNIEASARDLEDIYRGCVARAKGGERAVRRGQARVG